MECGREELDMLIVVTHRISNPQEFWGAAQRELPNLPAGIKLLQSLPNAEGNLASCVWEAASVPTLQTYLEDKTGKFAKNEYMAVEVANAINLPHAH
jgi:hypothetical protein